MKALIDYIMEGRKQKLANTKSFNREIEDKYGHNTPEYFKAMTDFLVVEILWKFPEIKYRGTETADRKMGYSGIPAKDYTIEYTYKNHVLGFKFSSFFANPFCYFKIDGKDITHDIKGSFGDLDILLFMHETDMIAKYKELIGALL